MFPEAAIFIQREVEELKMKVPGVPASFDETRSGKAWTPEISFVVHPIIDLVD